MGGTIIRTQRPSHRPAEFQNKGFAGADFLIGGGVASAGTASHPRPHVQPYAWEGRRWTKLSIRSHTLECPRDWAETARRTR